MKVIIADQAGVCFVFDRPGNPDQAGVCFVFDRPGNLFQGASIAEIHSASQSLGR
ncbi:MAG: hypothetical protein NT018_14165 [Armatimonadetes bacterium]|nr:hypothetical protein [Armatimonadota bacterium]